MFYQNLFGKNMSFYQNLFFVIYVVLPKSLLQNVAVCSSSPKWTQKMIINYLYF